MFPASTWTSCWMLLSFETALCTMVMYWVVLLSCAALNILLTLSSFGSTATTWNVNVHWFPRSQTHTWNGSHQEDNDKLNARLFCALNAWEKYVQLCCPTPEVDRWEPQSYLSPHRCHGKGDGTYVSSEVNEAHVRVVLQNFLYFLHWRCTWCEHELLNIEQKDLCFQKDRKFAWGMALSTNWQRNVKQHKRIDRFRQERHTSGYRAPAPPNPCSSTIFTPISGWFLFKLKVAPWPYEQIHPHILSVWICWNAGFTLQPPVNLPVSSSHPFLPLTKLDITSWSWMHICVTKRIQTCYLVLCPCPSEAEHHVHLWNLFFELSCIFLFFSDTVPVRNPFRHILLFLMYVVCVVKKTWISKGHAHAEPAPPPPWWMG